MFGDRLASAVKRAGAPVAVGLDPHLDRLPQHLQAGFKFLEGAEARVAAADAVVTFHRLVLEALAGRVAAVKLQFAFFEQLGSPGYRALEITCEEARRHGLLVIGDAKRGDIGSTMAAYGRSTLDPGGPLAVDALTVNPWMGTDTLAPLLPWCAKHGRGLFVLVRTTNPGSAEFQLHGQPRAAWKLAARLNEMGRPFRGQSGTTSLGAVVGASAPKHATELREHMPDAWFLVPGIGAQGGSADDAMAGARDDGLGSLAVASRSVLFPAEPTPAYDAEPGDFVAAQADALKCAVQDALHRRMNG